MNCPLLMASSHRDVRPRCMEEECAWWDARKGCCAVLTLVDMLTRIFEPNKAAREA